MSEPTDKECRSFCEKQYLIFSQKDKPPIYSHAGYYNIITERHKRWLDFIKPLYEIFFCQRGFRIVEWELFGDVIIVPINNPTPT